MEPEATQQVWIYVDESDSHRGRALSQRILDTLRAAGCPGATVLRGVGGFGVHGIVHSDLLVDVPSHLPLVITFIDRADRVAAVLPALRELVSEGLIALTPVQVIQHSHREGGPFPRHLTVADVMSRDVARVAADTPVAEVVALLIDRALGALPVTDADGRVIGIITDGDVLRRAGRRVQGSVLQRLATWFGGGARPEDLELAASGRTAADIMTSPVVSVTPETPTAEAIKLMMAHRVKRLPVIDAKGRLAGMIGRAAVLGALSSGREATLG